MEFHPEPERTRGYETYDEYTLAEKKAYLKALMNLIGVELTDLPDAMFKMNNWEMAQRMRALINKISESFGVETNDPRFMAMLDQLVNY